MRVRTDYSIRTAAGLSSRFEMLYVLLSLACLCAALLPVD